MIKIDEKFNIIGFSRKIFDRILSKDHAFEGEAHDFWEIVFVDSGKIEIVENENVYIMGEGDILFHAPMEFHKLFTTENTTPHVLNMSFTADGTLPSNLKDGVFSLNSEQSRAYIKLFKFIRNNLIEKENPDFFTSQEVANTLSAFIIRLCSEAQSQETCSMTASALNYKALVNLMKDEIYNNISIKELSEKSFVSVSYIKLLFQHYAGISPKNYYNNLRIIEAKHLLGEGLSVAATADKMNFSSANNFVRFFKSLTSVTPYQYKKKPDL